jgi:hypothetical protein
MRSMHGVCNSVFVSLDLYVLMLVTFFEFGHAFGMSKRKFQHLWQLQLPQVLKTPGSTLRVFDQMCQNDTKRVI